MKIKKIKRALLDNNIIWRKHALQRMFERDITRDEIKSIILNGEIIEEYFNDKPFPSMLFYHKLDDRHLHLVAAFDEINNKLHIVTSYEPTLEIFKKDYKTRRK